MEHNKVITIMHDKEDQIYEVTLDIGDSSIYFEYADEAATRALKRLLEAAQSIRLKTYTVARS